MEVLTPLDLNDYLSTKSNWHRRFFYDEPYSIDRDVACVENEYDKDRYLPLLRALEEGRCCTIEDCKKLEFSLLEMDQDYSHIFSVKDRIYRAPLRVFRALYYSVLRDIVIRYGTGRLCELGCGYGFNLNLFADIAPSGHPPYGGEISDNCVKIAQHFGLPVSKFDFLNRVDYGLIQPGATVFTHHAVEQLPTAREFLDNLAGQRERINEVILLEPTCVEERTTLLGGMRNKFNRMIDHNHDLLSLIRGREDVEIITLEVDVIGMHPLNSTNVIAFRFV